MSQGGSAVGLIGRDAELAAIDERLAALGRGSAEVLVLGGETGIGKSALLGVLAARARELGHRVLSGTAAEFQADVPFVVVNDALEGVADLLEGDALAAERYTAYRALGRALGALARERPVLVLLDDLHWADPASVEVVSHLLRRRPEGPVLLALAMRPAQTPAPLAAAVQRAVREGGCHELHLRPLDPAECDRLLGPEVGRGRRRELEALSGGNPFFLRQLARAPAPAPGDPPTGLDDLELPLAVRAAVAEELRSLDAVPLRLLEGCAVVGDPFAPEFAVAASGLAEGDARDALDVLAAADLDTARWGRSADALPPSGDPPRRLRGHGARVADRCPRARGWGAVGVRGRPAGPRPPSGALRPGRRRGGGGGDRARRA